tara:strand:+ start:157 stop:378 length:222 start_codon:yes stop_codon:yes gene_type:complete
MPDTPLLPPLLLRQFACISIINSKYDIEHLYKRLINNKSFCNIFKDYLDAGEYIDLRIILEKDERFNFLWDIL